MKDEKEKQEILAFFREVTEQTQIKPLLRELEINDASFYSCRYSLERMQEVKSELQRRLLELSKK